MRKTKNQEKNLDKKPTFLITIDTEGDNLWSRPRSITTQNAAFLPRFQNLCESYHLKPTYLTNYEMVQSSVFIEFGKDIIRRQVGEIGMHLHAWNTPPLDPLTTNDFSYHPYLTEYPEDIMKEKITIMTNLLEETFGVKMVSHRAGRWGFNKTYAKMLVKKGYCIDCSVTPHVSWKKATGHPNKEGGPDFSQFLEEAYFLDLDDIKKRGNSSLLEIPMTIMSINGLIPGFMRQTLNHFSIGKRLLNWPIYWLRPNGKNRNHLLRVVKQAIFEKRDYIEFMLHSSELMPGGNPFFTTDKDIEILYEDLEILFSLVKKIFVGKTLKEYHNQFVDEELGRVIT